IHAGLETDAHRRRGQPHCRVPLVAAAKEGHSLVGSVLAGQLICSGYRDCQGNMESGLCRRKPGTPAALGAPASVSVIFPSAIEIAVRFCNYPAGRGLDIASAALTERRTGGEHSESDTGPDAISDIARSNAAGGVDLAVVQCP